MGLDAPATATAPAAQTVSCAPRATPTLRMSDGSSETPARTPPVLQELFDAAVSGDCAQLVRALAAGAAVNGQHPEHYHAQPLHAACYAGRADAAAVLLEHGADPTSRNDFGLTPYQVAVLEGRQSASLERLFRSHGVRTAPRRFLRCYINHANAGFFAQVQMVLHQALQAERIGLEPVAYIGHDSLDGPNGYYCPAKGTNVWEYYFEPMGGVRYEHAWEAVQREPGAQLLELTSAEVWRLHTWEAESVYTYPYGLHKRMSHASDDEIESWQGQMRARGAEAIRKYVRVRADILAKVDAFQSAYFAPMTIGCHLRGTDKTDLGAGALSRVIPPELYFADIDSFLREHPGGKVFVATDQRQFREALLERYGDRMVHCDAQVMEGNVNAFQAEQTETGRVTGGSTLKPYRKGEDVLIDCLLLSRCSALLKCTSAVGEFAMYFNPALPCFDMNVKYRRITVSPTAASPPGLNPTQMNVIAFKNTHERAMWPWTMLLATSWVRKPWVAAVWRFFSVTLGLGCRNVAA